VNDSPANGTPEELRRLARPCVSNHSFYPAPVLTMIYSKTSAKNLWGAYASKRNTKHTRASRNWSSNFPADRAGVG